MIRWDKPAPYGRIRYVTKKHVFDCAVCSHEIVESSEAVGHSITQRLQRGGWGRYWPRTPDEKWVCPECVKKYEFDKGRGERKMAE